MKEIGRQTKMVDCLTLPMEKSPGTGANLLPNVIFPGTLKYRGIGSTLMMKFCSYFET